MDDATAGAADLAREIERVADRLRVLGPRLAARASARSRAGAPAADSGQDSVAAQDARTLEQIRDTLQVLADLAADAEGRPHRPVPELAPHGLADQVLVLGHDLLAAPDSGRQASGLAVLADLRRAL
jgi:hypothetical protein